MRLELGKRNLSWFSITILILLIVGYLCYGAIANVYATGAARRESHQFLSTCDHLYQGIVQAETSQRGYLLSNETDYLEPFQEAEQTALYNLQQLSERRNYSPAESDTFTKLELDVKNKFEELT